ncbi:MAG: ECF transporter S component [Clostridia bacterium]|nr:ECF transporter S component [Clostridia bacterium]
MKRKEIVRLVTLAMFVAISVILIWFVHFPIFPVIPFMEYDPADIPIFIGSFMFGPWWGLALTAVASIIQGVTVCVKDGIVGIIMHVVATGSFVISAGFIYKRNKTRKTARIALIAGTLAMVCTMVLWDLLVLPYYMGIPVSAVVQLLPFIILFNLIKAGGNACITYFLYKPLRRLIERIEK